MSDEIPLDFEHQRRLKLWLCAEIWTDVFKLLTRRQLVQRVQPVHRRFKEICDQNVDNVHVIQNANEFIERLAKNLPEANQQYADLKANNCPLADQFRLAGLKIHICHEESKTNPAKFKRRLRFQQCVMRHFLDTFRGCRLLMLLPKLVRPADAVEYLAYLKLLYPVEPDYIELAALFHFQSFLPSALKIEELFKEPTILNCRRLSLLQAAKNEPGAQAIYDWLHFCPIATGGEAGNVAAEEGRGDGEKVDKVRCLTISGNSIENSIEELLDKCIQDLQQAKARAHHRPFVFNFYLQPTLAEFREENQITGEVLSLQALTTPNNFLPTSTYRLQRCLAQDLEGRETFCENLFSEFKFDGRSGEKSTLVEIS